MSSVTRSLQFSLGGVWLAEHTLQTLGAGVAVFDHDARLTQADDRTIELLCLESTGSSDYRLDHDRWSAIHLDGAPLQEHSDPVRLALSIESASVADVIGVYTDEDQMRWLAVTALPLAGFDGRTQAVLASFVEVTGIIRDRAAVDLAEQLGRAAFDDVGVALCVVDERFDLVEWNRAFAVAVDRPDYELLATPLERWIEDARAAVLEARDEKGTTTMSLWLDGSPVCIRAWRTDQVRSGATMVQLT
ncbi:MAG: hypothetical protein AB8G14_10825 [Ilumatobacter sp.]